MYMLIHKSLLGQQAYTSAYVFKLKLCNVV